MSALDMPLGRRTLVAHDQTTLAVGLLARASKLYFARASLEEDATDIVELDVVRGQMRVVGRFDGRAFWETNLAAYGGNLVVTTSAGVVQLGSDDGRVELVLAGWGFGPALVADDSGIYVYQHDERRPKLWKLDPSHSAPMVVAVLDPAGNGGPTPQSVALGPRHLYWVTSGRSVGVVRRSKVGGSDSLAILPSDAGAEEAGAGVVVHGEQAFLIYNRGQTLQLLAWPETEASPLLLCTANARYNPGSGALVHAGHVYFQCQTLGCELARVPVEGGALELVSEPLEGGVEMAIVDGALYVLSHVSSAVHRLSLNDR